MEKFSIPQDNTEKEEDSNLDENLEKEFPAEKFDVLYEKFSKIVKWSTLGTLLTVSVITAKEVNDRFEEETKYQSYLENTLSIEDRHQYENIKDRLISEFGESAVKAIEAGDKAAFVHRDDLIQKPHFEGFNKIYKENSWLHTENLPKFMFTEDYGMYPQNWINGEITKVILKEKPYDKKAGTSGSYVEDPETDRGTILLYDLQDNLTDKNISARAFYNFIELTFAHESGHSNDWETKSNLNLLERAELLDKVLERINSHTPYSDGDKLENSEDYWKSFDDGTQSGKYRAAREYWAELCEVYFTDAESFKQNMDDFELVHEVVIKTDPNFDIFDTERGAYDSFTGEIREKWKKNVEEEKPKLSQK